MAHFTENTDVNEGGGPPVVEPIAIVGIGCRLPGGADSPAAFWALLKNGVDAVTEVPPDRWNIESFYDPDPKRGKTYSRWGGFLKQVDMFDAQFFKIAPREAVYMDPQQRILLEVCWEALEDGGQDVDRLSGTNAGVFIGASTHDYADMQAKDVYSSEAYTNSGCTLSIAANRLSYFFDLHGPSIAVDTACSSSLVAVHLACQSIWSGECGLALTGGVNCMLTPEATIGFSRARMLSPNGRCSSFDAGADGYVRGEGAGVVVLKPLAAALAARDPIYAVIVGTGVNQDGHTHGLTVPSGEAQEALLREVYRRANIDPLRVLYFEAHGTGTPVGDPIEAAAIGAALGKGRSRENLLRIGSHKTNIGHLEAAAGITGLIKAALLIKHRQIPASLHFRTPNPKIPFEELGLRVQQEIEVIPDDEGATAVGVNAFGFGGTNAHVVLDRVPVAATRDGRESPTPSRFLVPLSARCPEALQALAGGLRERVSAASVSALTLGDLCYTAGARRTHHEHRLAVVAGSLSDLADSLDALVKSEAHPGVFSGRRTSSQRPRLAFVFSGMGPQWWAMGRQLLAAEPVFKKAVEECCEQFQRDAGWSLMDQLTSDSGHSRMDEAQVAQPANFALQVGLMALWRSWGVAPDAIVGHSAGEVAAAFAAGVLSFEDACLLIYHRSRLQQRATGNGRMMAVGLPSSQASAALGRFRGRISLAAINSPRSVTLAGDEDALEQLAQALRDMQVFTSMLDTRVPYHSHHMDPLEEELVASLAEIAPMPAAIPFYSAVTGDRVDGRELDASYWWANIRKPVSFAPAIEKILEEGVDAFVELSPHPVLGRSIVEIQKERDDTSAVILASLRREVDERETMLAAMGALYTMGCRVEWAAVNGEGSCVPLPAYPWQRERFWTEPKRSVAHRLPSSVHPLLQKRLDLVNPSWEAHLDGQRLAYLRDHVIQGSVVFPTSAYIEAALAGSRELTGEHSCVLEDVRFKRALILREEEVPRIQFVVQPQDNTFSVHSCLQAGQAWTLNATGRFARDPGGTVPARPSRLPAIQARCRRSFSNESCYDALNAVGLQYGPRFRGIQQIWHGQREALGRIWRPEELAGDHNGGHIFHPAVLDACFQVISGAAFLQRGSNGMGDSYLPVEIGRFRFLGTVPGRGLWCHAKLTSQNQSSLQGDFSIFDDDGNVIVEIAGFKCQRVPNTRTTTTEELNRCLHEVQWYARMLPAGQARQTGYATSVSKLAKRLMTPEMLERHGRKEHYEDVYPQFDRLCAAYAWEALRRLGWRPRRGQRVNLTGLAEQLNIVPPQRSHLRRLLEILEEDGVLRKAASDWVVSSTSVVADSAKLRRAIGEKHPSYEADMVILERCGAALADVLRGTRDPRQLLFPEGSLADLTRSYTDSAFVVIYNAFIRDCVSAVVHSLPKGRTIRVLEIGAGTGGTTASVLSVLPPNRTEYVFTDVSEVFITAAKSRFIDYPFVDYVLLDIEEDLQSQGFAPHSFDLIIASDVLHATGDLRQALMNVATLLSSDGLLIAMEITRDWRLFDILYGPLRDWWRFAESDPRSSRFWLSPAAWSTVLAECGFVETAAISDGGSTWEAAQAVLLARGPHIENDAIDVQPATSAPAGVWIVFVDQGGVGDRLASEIEGRGDAVIRVSAGEVFAHVSDRHFQVCPGSLESMATLVRAVGGALSNCLGLIHLWCLDADELKQSGNAALEDVQKLGCESVLYLVQALDRAEVVAPPRLWLMTRGAQCVGEETRSARAAQALLWGLGRVIMNEQPQFRSTLLDLDPDGGLRECAHLADELYAQDAEQEIAWRGDGRYVVRLVRSRLTASDSAAPQLRTTDRHTAFQLEAAKPGALESLRLREVQRRRPGRGEVEIEIRAAGINFRDVMKAMGMYLDRLGEAFCFGDECAGTIVRVGEEISDFAVGDEVIGLGSGCFGRFVTMPAKYVVRKPANLTFEQAATIPIVFLTVHYALNHVARIKKGERVLIHSAAGGVGLAAVQLAQKAGAEIFATAGSPEKRALLSSLGVHHVMDSRSLAFADEVMSLTGGRGLDVVLNSLAGEFLIRSLALLRPTGRFLELGKVDFFENTRLGLAPFSRGLSFLGVDLGFLLENEPDFCRQLFAEVMQMFEEGTLRPLPVQTFPVSEASSAFRFIAQARHIGKVVLSMSEQPRTVVRLPAKTSLFREDATYLVTGGLRGFGLATAEWMVQQGARHLVLVGRTGASSADAEAGVKKLRDAGAAVVAAKADVSKEDSVAAVLAEIDRTMPPLRGVFHAAMVLDDGFLLQLDADRMQRVIAPKALGAWNLHRHTLEKKLDFFVLFSSIASLQGSPGQGNYSAANAFLDALAHHRRVLNLPALVVNWGAISEVGYVARNPEIGQVLQQQGILGIGPAEAGSLLGTLLKSDRCQAAAIRLDLEHLNVIRTSESASRRFSFILQQSQQDPGKGPGTQKALLVLLAGSAPDARPHLVEAALRVDLARVLGVRESQINPEQPLADLGVDSLMSVELETVVQTALGIDLPLGFLVSDNVSLRHLSRRLADQSQAAIDLLAASRVAGKEVVVRSVAAAAVRS